MDQKDKFNYYNITTWPDHGLNYWGIPKCGNTSIKYALIGRKVDYYNASDTVVWVHNIKSNEYITRNEALSNGRINVTVVRHPFDRVMSLYRDFVLRRPRHHNKGATNLEDFVYNVILDSEDSVETDIHYRSISYFIANSDRTSILVNNIFDIKDIDQFYKRFGLKNILINKNRFFSEEELSTVHKKLIFNRYKDDFRLLGYSEL